MIPDGNSRPNSDDCNTDKKDHPCKSIDNLQLDFARLGTFSPSCQKQSRVQQSNSRLFEGDGGHLKTMLAVDSTTIVWLAKVYQRTILDPLLGVTLGVTTLSGVGHSVSNGCCNAEEALDVAESPEVRGIETDALEVYHIPKHDNDPSTSWP